MLLVSYSLRLSALLARVWLPVTLALAAAPALADTLPPVGSSARVHAIYNITWNGLPLGDFTWDSNISEGQYKVATSAKIVALLGAYTWDGATRVSGAYQTGAPHPAAYKFRFDATNKSGRIDMGFANGKVARLSQDPPDNGSSGRVPLKPAHLENVLDPLSAILAMSSPGSGTIETVNPCERHLSLFDGTQRFDLVLSLKRKAHLDNAAGAKTVFVCKIQYVPIAGMKMNTETKYMASTDGIEVWLAPVVFANAFIPVNVVVPTWAGSAQITSSKVQIDMPGRGQTALSSR